VFNPQDKEERFRDFLFAAIHTGLRPFCELARMPDQDLGRVDWRYAESGFRSRCGGAGGRGANARVPPFMGAFFLPRESCGFAGDKDEWAVSPPSFPEAMETLEALDPMQACLGPHVERLPGDCRLRLRSTRPPARGSSRLVAPPNATGRSGSGSFLHDAHCHLCPVRFPCAVLAALVRGSLESMPAAKFCPQQSARISCSAARDYRHKAFP
jgi:hypothetical protein